MTTLYILIGILLEERDLTAMFGDDYRHYRDRVSMLLPWRTGLPKTRTVQTPPSPTARLDAE